MNRQLRFLVSIIGIVIFSMGGEVVVQANEVPASSPPTAQPKESSAAPSAEPDLILESIGQKRPEIPQSVPTYRINRVEIEQQGAKNVADALRNLPGLAINDAGFGADIHTGTYYRGASINQVVILLNGRPINANISTYHGNTDLNSIPVAAIDRIELFSGAGTILYGSEAFGGAVNIITKTYSGKPQTNLTAELGSLGRANYQASQTGGNDQLNYRIGIEKYRIDNNYTVPVGAANRDPATGKLFNADSDTTSYSGSISAELNPRNRLDIDTAITASRRGLVYFGFPLQRDRLNHDTISLGAKLRTQLSTDQSSILTSSIGYAKDYFETFGPSGNDNSRTGILDTQALTGRVDHNWRTSPTNTLRWGGEVQIRKLNGSANSTVPERIAFNGTQNRDTVNSAFFAVNNWKITDKWEVDLGIRQNINSQFGSYLNPSLGTRWQLSPQVAFRASATGAQRNPGLDQLYLYDTVHGWLPNPDLQPETGTSWNTGLDINLSPSSIAKISYFGSTLNNRIATIATSSTTTQWSNIGQVRTNGLELSLRQQLSPEWSAFANYTYTDAKIQSGPGQGLQLAFIPYSVAQLGVGYAHRGWELNLLTNYNSGTRRAFFNNSGQTATDFWTLDIFGFVASKIHPLAKDV